MTRTPGRRALDLCASIYDHILLNPFENISQPEMTEHHIRAVLSFDSVQLLKTSGYLVAWLEEIESDMSTFDFLEFFNGIQNGIGNGRREAVRAQQARRAA